MEQGKIAEKKSKNTYVYYIVGCLCLLAVIGACGFWLVPKPTSSRPIAVFDMRAVLVKMPQYQRLLHLYAEEEKMQQEANAFKPLLPRPTPLPHAQGILNAKRTENDVQTSQQVAQVEADLKAKYTSLEKQYAAKKANAWQNIRNKYKNALFNYSLKLQNADNLHLSPTDITKIEQEQKHLQESELQEKALVDKALDEEFLLEFTKYKEAQVSKLQADIKSTMQKNLLVANAEHAKWQEDNIKMVQAQLQAMDTQKQQMQTLRQALQAKKSEIQSLETAMIKEVQGLAEQLAVQNKYSAVITIQNDPLTPLDVAYPSYIITNKKQCVDITQMLIDKISR